MRDLHLSLSWIYHSDRDSAKRNKHFQWNEISERKKVLRKKKKKLNIPKLKDLELNF
jgi:hypothetical protein